MGPIFQEIIGAGFGGAFTILIVALVQSRGNVSRLPKRIDRLEMIAPPLLRAVLSLLKCQKQGSCDDSIEDSISELNEMMTSGVVSRKDKR